MFSGDSKGLLLLTEEKGLNPTSPRVLFDWASLWQGALLRLVREGTERETFSYSSRSKDVFINGKSPDSFSRLHVFKHRFEESSPDYILTQGRSQWA